MATSWLSGDTAVIEERASAPALITGKGQLWFNTSTHYLHYVDSTGVDYLVATDIIDAAPADATYIVKTSNSTLTNEFALASLGTGLLKVTTGTGDLTSITTSAGISALLSDETGSGALVFNDTPTILTPTIASFVNANHTHLNVAGGGTLDTAAIATGQLALARGGANADLSATGGTGQFLRQSSAGAAVTVAVIASADITTALTTPGPIGGTTPNTGKFTSVTVSGTAGAGYVELLNQSSAPSTPSSAGRLFFDNSNRFSWIGTNTYTRTFDGTANSANRIYVLPDQAGAILLATYTGAVASTGTHTITGSADAVQLTILANGTNTSDLVQLQSSIGAVQTRISSDGRLALYGSSFADAFTLIQAGGTISVDGSANTRVMYRMGPKYIVTTANQTAVMSGASFGLTVDQNGFNVSATPGGVRGFFGSATVSGASGIVTSATATLFQLLKSGAGTLTSGYANYTLAPSISGGGTFTSYAAIAVESTSGATNNTLLLLGTGTIASGNFTIDANSSTYASRLGAALTITGSADAIQQTIKDNSTQTSVSQSWQSSGGTTRFQIGPSTVASAAGAVAQTLYGAAQTITITGSTNITTATGFNFVEFGTPTYSTASALTITIGATVYIAGPPVAAGAGPAAITNAYALWIDSGASRFDGTLDLSNAAANLVLNVATGCKIATGTTQKLAFWNATPIAQPANTVALDTLLVNTGLRASGGVALFDTDVKIGVVGKGLYIKEGTNGTMGTATLTAGSVTISTTKVTASSRIFLTDAGGGVLANLGSLYYTNVSAGTSFDIKSSNNLDTSNVNWIIIEPA